MTNGHTLSMSLLAGLFLSNYPEALSSSASMREQGIPFKKVLMAWTLIMVLTGIGAGLGSIVLAGETPDTFAFIGGLAAGAMLTVIAETMLPEAYVKGGSIIGFVTLLGFLTAISFKAFDTIL
jgi:zinc transporter ZupT